MKDMKGSALPALPWRVQQLPSRGTSRCARSTSRGRAGRGGSGSCGQDGCSPAQDNPTSVAFQLQGKNVQVYGDPTWSTSMVTVCPSVPDMDRCPRGESDQTSA